ncbi:recombinase family protein [Streptomyces sp. NPDC018000]|uniref:recombinase family protein n=1 Tax=Streptomyces sp. NPDC018000 TaxID=3365028 RepID=UPI0037B449D6
MIPFDLLGADGFVVHGMDLSSEQMNDLRELASSRHSSADVALRARIVLWSAEGRRRKDVAELAGVVPVTVDRCKARYATRGLAGPEEKRRGGPRDQVPPRTRGRVIALTKVSPPADSGLSHWSTRTLADHLKRREGISVPWHYIARIWREEHRPIPDPPRASAVTYIFQLRGLDKLGYDAIADRLNLDLVGYPPPEPIGPDAALGRWSGSAVREILRNPKYTGYKVWNRRATKKGGHNNDPKDWVWSPRPTHEPLVTKELFDTVSTVGRKRQGSRTTHGANAHPATKRPTSCDICDRRMFSKTRHADPADTAALLDALPHLDVDLVLVTGGDPTAALQRPRVGGPPQLAPRRTDPAGADPGLPA